MKTVYDFMVKDRAGNDVSLSEYNNKVLLIVNTATGCGFTPHYEPLEAMYKELRDKHGQTPWGKQAAMLMSNRLTLTDKDLERLRKRVKSSEAHVDKLSAQYYESLNKAPEEKKAEVKSQEDEILENTYNSMYDFE